MMTMIPFKAIVCTLVMLLAVAAQPASSATEIDAVTKKETVIIPLFEKIDMSIDGRLNEAIWSEVPGYNDMKVIQPDTLKGLARKATCARAWTHPWRFAVATKDEMMIAIEALKMGLLNQDQIQQAMNIQKAFADKGKNAPLLHRYNTILT